eukprot:m.115452 g.115452  ORF g.115452 m.115452 type:complete len:723 (-) comp15370_c3_seq1:99-2267(-)
MEDNASAALTTVAANITTTSANTTTTASPTDVNAPLWQSIITLCLLGVMLIAMAKEWAPPDMLMIGILILFVPMGIITINEAVEGFSNTGMLTVAVLFPVAAGVQLTGAIEPLRRLLERRTRPPPGQRADIRKVLAWIMFPIGVLSAFLNNTPVVAMMIPLVERLGQRLGISPSKLLIPLSYASILGGTCTLIGTSTNLVVIGLVSQRIPGFSMGIFELGQVGLPVLFAGVAYVVIFAQRILPDRQSVTSAIVRPREYITCMFIKTASEANGHSLEGKSVLEAGLRSLPGLFLVQIERENGTVVSAPSPDTLLQGGDKLFFAGKVDSVLSLSQVRGLRLAEDDEDEVDLNRLKGDDILVEAVVAPHSALVHRSVKDAAFRSRYKAAIIAVHRHGVRINKKIGEIVLQAGDALLLVTNKDFVSLYQHQDDFALVSAVDGHVSFRWKKAPIAVFLTVAMIALSVADVIDLLTAAIFAAGGLVLFRCMSASELRSAINLEVLLVIAAAFGLSNALVNSGAAQLMADGVIIASKPTGIVGLYIMVYLTTMLFSAVVTNNAAITIMFPVAYQAALDLDVDFFPLLLLLMMGASASFLTPTGYQTNLMVYGPGGYTFTDFLKFGGMLQIWLGVITVSIVATLDFWYLWLLGCIAFAIIAFFIPQPKPKAREEVSDLEAQLTEAAHGNSPGRKEMYYYQPDLGLAKVEYFADEDPPETAEQESLFQSTV